MSPVNGGRTRIEDYEYGSHFHYRPDSWWQFVRSRTACQRYPDATYAGTDRPAGDRQADQILYPRRRAAIRRFRDSDERGDAGSGFSPADPAAADQSGGCDQV